MTIYGKNIKLCIYGGSHDEKIGMKLSGIPSGLEIDMDALLALMARRAPGKNKHSTGRSEPDVPVFVSGVENGITNGDEIEAVIYNRDQHSGDYADLSDIPRPAHADYPARVKFGNQVDLRGGGHFSGRLTAPMCIAGAICRQLLETRGIHIGAHIYSIADVKDSMLDPLIPSAERLSNVKTSPFPTLDAAAGELMQDRIEAARLDGDSVGGVIECAATGLPVGLGEHMFDSIEGRLCNILFGIPAVKGVEFGLGFGATEIRGSQNNDEYYTDGEKIYTYTNNCGGILGGMTNGAPLIFRVAFKPTPSIAKAQRSVSLSKMENVQLSIHGRHDPCVVPRAVPVVEAACAIALLDILYDQQK